MEISVISVEDLKQILRDAIKESSMAYSSNQKQSSNEFLPMDEAAKYLKIPKASIYQLTSKREIPFIKRSRRIFFKKSDLDSWLEDGRKKTRQELEYQAMQEIGKGGKRR